jgi:hypothetical protein
MKPDTFIAPRAGAGHEAFLHLFPADLHVVTGSGEGVRNLPPPQSLPGALSSVEQINEYDMLLQILKCGNVSGS